MEKKRWKAVVRFIPENIETVQYYIDEIEELQDLIEQGADFNLIRSITITYNYHVKEE